MKSKYIKSRLVLLGLAFTIGFVGCTDSFESTNTNPNGLPADKVQLATRFSQPITSVYLNYQNRHYEFQLQQNLNADLYSGYLANPTPFGGNFNNSTYAMNDGWNNQAFNAGFQYVMKPISEILKSTEELDFVSIAKIVRVQAMHRVADIYGPLPYTRAMQGGDAVPYDDLETIYKTFLTELEESVNDLTTFVDTEGADAGRLTTFDIVCKADHKQWIRFANSLRLRLAMRIVKVEPALAKATAEAAVSHKYGVLKAGDPNVEVIDGTVQNPLHEISYAYGDTRVGALLVNMLKGYDDPRLPKYVTPIGWLDNKDIIDKNENATNSIGDYVGIRQGVLIPDKSDYVMFSTVNMPRANKNTDQSGDKEQITNALPWMKVAEVYFLRAEGALRGWQMDGSAQALYEEGIKVSFDEFAISSSDYNAYISNDSGVAADYVDPFNAENNIQALDKATVKWDNSLGNEEKLHKIINQKWLSMYPEGQEAWSEFRRTGYPKLFPVANNFSANTESGIAEGQFVKRLRFTRNERNSHEAEVIKARELLGGPDNEGTRLWWDTGGANF